MSTQARDPVCGALLDPRKAKGHQEEYHHASYFFCSTTCQKRFHEHPEDFVESSS
jgi:YHS domain-containing protein